MSQKSKVEEAIADVDFSMNNYQICLETTEGDIRLDLASEKAPGHCKNMIGLARVGFYDSLIFHRVIDGFMIQGGCPEGTGTGNPGYSIDAEFNDMAHEPGVLSMARSASPNSAGSQFFVCLDSHSHLDGSYTAFGKTADQASLDVVMKIGNCEKGQSDRPVKDISMTKVTVCESPIA